MLRCSCVIQYEGNKTLVTVSLKHLNEVFSRYPDTKITISRIWADKYNSALSLIAGKVQIETEKVQVKTNETDNNEEVIPYKTIN